MTNALRIADVASQAGVSTATVRFYERTGVLPQPDRAANGYRSYTERTVERLAFITRAKRLGCTLEEITALVTAWEGGQCGPVQDQLRSLVAEKLATTRTDMADLVTFSAELQVAASSLELHRPVGPCDDTCGCVSQPVGLDRRAINVGGSTPWAVTLIGKSDARSPAPVACTLSPHQLADQIGEWALLLNGDGRQPGKATGRKAIDGGVHIEFDPSTDIAALAQLVTREQVCCQFLSFAITVDHRGLGLDVTTSPDGLPVVYELFGAPQ